MKVMKKYLVLFLLFMGICAAMAQSARMVQPAEIRDAQQNYINNRAPLPANPFIKLPPGSIQARGWVRSMLLRQQNGLNVT